MPTLETYDGTEVTVEHVEALPDGGGRFDVRAEDGRHWRIDVDRDGGTSVVTTRRDGELADLETPDWLGDVVARLRREG